jgi:hypothetical protein
MAELFTDTSGWGNLVDPTQPYHNLTAKMYRMARQQKRKVVTTNYIIAELVALLTSPLRVPRPAIVSFIEGLKSSPYIQVVHVDALLMNRRGNCSRPDRTRCGVWSIAPVLW